jgi:phosphoglycerate dehydrogenase-like enzyme
MAHEKTQNHFVKIMGLGAIGVQIANAASMLGMKVIGFDPSITIKSAWKLSADVEQALSVDELFSTQTHNTQCLTW